MTFSPENLVLEVEVPTDIPNIVPNPNGENGPWGWTTPIANTKLETVLTDIAGTYFAPLLKLSTTPSQGVSAATERMPAIAGKYYQARMDIAEITVGHNIKMWFNWYDASKTIISTATASPSVNGGTVFYGPFVAPSNAAYVVFGLNLYKGTGITSADAGAHVTFNRVMVTYSDSGTTIQTRTNMFANPSGETNTNGFTSTLKVSTKWSSGDNETVSPIAPTRTSADKYVGTYSIKVVPPTPGDYSDYGHIVSRTWSGNVLEMTAGWTVSKNTVYALSFYGKTNDPSTGKVLRTTIHWTDGTTTQLADGTVNSSAWKRLQWTFNTGNKTGISKITVLVPNTATWVSGRYYLFDGIMLEKSSSVGDYFDGDTTDTADWTYSWNGTANASTSLAQSAASRFGYNDAHEYVNILGSASEISVSGAELDIRTLTASIKDADLDPAVADQIRPGKNVRLRARYVLDDTEYWTNVFVGKTDNAVVDYDTKPHSKVPVSITLTAIDAVATLAAQNEPSTVSTVAQLPYILEGKGVPWNVDGNYNQVSSATVLFTDPEKTVVDQIALIRDTYNHYAFVDRNGILQVSQTTTINDFAYDLYLTDVSEDLTYNVLSYSDMPVSFSTTECVNAVNITQQAWDGTQIVETAYTFEDTASIAQWGRYAKDFTITSAVTPSAFASAVFAANAQPRLRIASATVPVKTDDDIFWVANADLYCGIFITNSDKFSQQKHVVTGLTHSIVIKQGTQGYEAFWSVALDFMDSGSVASPAVQPNPGGTVGDTSWQTPTFLNGWNTSSFVRYKIDAANNLHIQGKVDTLGTSGTAVFTLPAGYRPQLPAFLKFDLAPQSNSGVAKANVTSDGNVTFFYDTTFGYISFNIVVAMD